MQPAMEHAGSSYSSMVALCHDLAVVTVALAQNSVWCFCPFAGARLSYPGPCTRDPSQAGPAKGLLGTCERAPKHGGPQLLRWEQGQEKQNSSAQAPLGRHGGPQQGEEASGEGNLEECQRRALGGGVVGKGLERFQEDLE